MNVLVARLVIATTLLAAPLAASAQVEEMPTRAGFTWEMEPRFGIDADGDGLIELENSHEYLHNRKPRSCQGACPEPRFGVTLQATPSADQLGVAPRLFSYEWRITGPGGAGTYFRSGPELRLLLPEGEHEIDVRVRVRILHGSVTLRSRSDILIDDVVVVALGDSYPSGEGSPDVPRGDGDALWADAVDPAAADSHALAHRSSVAWPVRTALALEQEDPHTSVSFVSFAATGARIHRGILTERANLGIPAQLDAVRDVLGERQIDVVLLQVGGNDIGFSQVIRQLVEADPLLDPICYEKMLDNVWASVRDGRWDRDVSLRYHPPFRIGCRAGGGARAGLPGLDGLESEMRRLASALEELGARQVILVEYPDPTGSTAEGDTCEEIVDDVTAPLGFHEVDASEQAEARERVLEPLNEELAAVAADLGWVFVGGVAASFVAGHGYCAPWPDYGYPEEYQNDRFFRDRLDHPEGWYRPPSPLGGPLVLNRGGVSWYRTASQSAALQGPAPRFLTSGTMHPNELGHMAIARLVLSQMAAVGADS